VGGTALAFESHRISVREIRMRTHGRRRSISDFRYTPIVAALGLALAPNAGHATTVIVDQPFDSTDTTGTTLRAAIQFFNSNCAIPASGPDLIQFNASFTSSGPFVTNLSSPLPTIYCSGLMIDVEGRQFDPVSRVQIVGTSIMSRIGSYP
jgi:hypothetical protein